MANCNDCICSEVCYYKSFNDVRTLKKRRNDVEKICKYFVHRYRLKNAPIVDAVEVVRCRECKHWLKDVTVCSGFVGRCDFANYMVGAKGYCSYGERKDGDGNG